MGLPYRADFHPALANLCKRLRYLLGGYRPSQTVNQLLSQYPDSRTPVRIHIAQGWCLIGAEAPTYTEHAKHEPNNKLQ